MVRTSQSTTFSSSPYFQDRGLNGTAQPITERINPHSRPIVSYYFPKGVGAQHYGERHPMKPHRLTLTNALVMGYGLDKQIHNMYDPRPATQEELENYHDHDYIDFLSKVAPQNQNQMKQMIDNFNCVEDCPIFADMYDFCKMYAGGSLAGARKLCAKTTDIAINWSGGLHHAKRGEASGFCYVNDIVLAILELLRYYPRVLYIDIDIHHGDGVEQAFYQSNRVMTTSFHKYTGDFFPGTGKLDDNGSGPGKHFCLNVPLLDGIDDGMYISTFKAVIKEVIDVFRPSAIVLQCGADSLGCDRLGAFNLSIEAHGDCVDFVRSYSNGTPLLVVGGGGYTIKNVSRCWTYETAKLVGAEIPNELPRTVYDSFFADSQWKLHPPLTGKVDNQNTPASLQRIIISIKNKLRYLQGAPSVQMGEIPPDLQGLLASEERTEEEKDEEQGTAQAGETRLDRPVARNDYFDGEKDNDKDTEMPPAPPVTTTRGRPAGPGRKAARGGRGRRGRPRGRGAAASATAPPTATTATSTTAPTEDGATPADDAADASASASAPVKPRGRTRGRPPRVARGRGRPPAVRAGSTSATNSAAARAETEESSPAQTPSTAMDVDMDP